MMKLNISPAPYPGAPVVVLSAGLGGAGGYWLPQRSALEAHYQLVSYDHNGTGENGGPLPAGYSMAQMAQELYAALLAAGLGRARAGRPPPGGRRWPRPGRVGTIVRHVVELAAIGIQHSHGAAFFWRQKAEAGQETGAALVGFLMAVVVGGHDF